MAIIIPSKNIYQITNPKVNNNLINSIKVSVSNVVSNNEYDKIVHREKTEQFELTNNPVSNEDIRSEGYSVGGGGTVAVNGVMGYAEAMEQKLVKMSIYIPMEVKNGYIEKIKTGTNDEGNPNIVVAIYGDREKGSASGRWSATYQNGFTITKGDVVYTKETTDSLTYKIPQSVNVHYVGGMYEIDYSMDVKDIGNISTATMTKTIVDEKEYFKIDLDIFCGIKIVSMGGGYTGTSGGVFNLNGWYEIYTPKSIEVAFYGDTVGISLEDNSVTYGTGNNPFSLDGNELLQNTKNAQKNANVILKEFENGKETAELLCSIDEYYDEYSEEDYENKPISIKSGRMSFNVGEEVIPYVFGAGGKDRPMSTYIDGTPKKFIVMGVNFIYDGAVWQKLTLQEASKE